DEADRGAAHRAAHALRPRDDGGDRVLQRHRELLSASVGTQAGRAAAHAHRLPALARADVRRRKPRDDSAGRRNVQGRSRTQGKSRQLRISPAVRTRQPPLRFDEFERLLPQTIFVSATPADYEHKYSGQVVEQVVRPTGLVDPTLDVRPAATQVDDLLSEITLRVERNER